MAEGNNTGDLCTKQEWMFLASAWQKVYEFHKEDHVNAKTLQHKFALSRADARKIVVDCPSCVVYHLPPTLGVNPRGLLPQKV